MIVPNLDGVTVRDFFCESYAAFRLAGGKASTREQFVIAINRLCRYARCEVRVAELSDDLVAGCLAEMIQQGRSPATANKLRAHILAIWRFARRRRLIAEEPFVDRLKEPKRVPAAWTVDELSQILAAAKETEGEICGIPVSSWWIALLLVLFDSGLRISAAMSLRWQDLDESSGTILVHAEYQKQCADQVPPLSEDSIDALRTIRRGGPLIFPWPYDQGQPGWPTLTRHLRKILTRAGLSSGRGDLFHRFRRSHASYLKRAGGDPTSSLGHSTPQVTGRYLDPSICRPPRQVDLLPRPVVPGHGQNDPQRTLFEI